jgi:hypothetical protein
LKAEGRKASNISNIPEFNGTKWLSGAIAPRQLARMVNGDDFPATDKMAMNQQNRVNWEVCGELGSLHDSRVIYFCQRLF